MSYNPALVAPLLVGLALTACGGDGVFEDESEQSIVNGFETNRPKAAVEMRVRRGGKWVGCGGAFVTKRHLVTSAGCVDGVGASNVEVRFGGGWHRPARYWKHPGFASKFPFGANIAVVKMRRRFSVRPLGYSTPATGDVIEIYGPGWSGSKRDNTAWRVGYNRIDSLKGNDFRYRGTTGAAFCWEDTGGPTLRRTSSGKRALLGVHSAIDPEKQANSDNLCEIGRMYDKRVDRYASWIRSKVGTFKYVNR